MTYEQFEKLHAEMIGTAETHKELTHRPSRDYALEKTVLAANHKAVDEVNAARLAHPQLCQQLYDNCMLLKNKIQEISQ